jgi:hypothetical protein
MLDYAHFMFLFFNKLLMSETDKIVAFPMSSKSPRFGRLTAIFKKIDDYIAVNK